MLIAAVGREFVRTPGCSLHGVECIFACLLGGLREREELDDELELDEEFMADWDALPTLAFFLSLFFSALVKLMVTSV